MSKRPTETHICGSGARSLSTLCHANRSLVSSPATWLSASLRYESGKLTNFVFWTIISHHSQPIIHKHSLLLSLPQAINNALLTNTIRVEIDGRFGCGFADLYKVESREEHVIVGLHSSWIFANFHQMERTLYVVLFVIICKTYQNCPVLVVTNRQNQELVWHKL